MRLMLMKESRNGEEGTAMVVRMTILRVRLKSKIKQGKKRKARRILRSPVLRKAEDQPLPAIQADRPEKKSSSIGAHIGPSGPGADTASGDAL